MEKGLKNFIDFISERYEVKLEQPNDFDAVWEKVGAVFYSPPYEEAQSIRDFFKNSKYQFVGFSPGRMIVRKLTRACSGTGKNKVYLKADNTLTKDVTEARYDDDDLIRRTIKELKKKKPVYFKNLKIDYA